MERHRQEALDQWLARSPRPPLILRGARQVGKSWLVRTWGERRFAHVVEANFERRPELQPCFADNDPRVVLRRLEVVLARPITPDGSTLLFLDEIQAAPEVLAKLRWFAEEVPQLPVVAAGSLLDFAIADASFSMPVGRVTFLHLEPMGFHEFCRALGEAPLVAWMRELTARSIAGGGHAVFEPLHDRALRLFREWVLVGGMPAAVELWRVGRSHLDVASMHRDLLATLRDDFAKYAGRIPRERLAAVLASVARQLGAKFTYRGVDPDERADALRRAVDLLCRARVCHRVVATSARGVPIGADANWRWFKLLHLDIGLACTNLGLDLRDLDEVADLTLVNRGAIAEQAVGQLLRLTFPPNAEPALYTWHREQRGSEAELDYVIAHGPRIVPIEVKSGAAGAMKSLHGFVAERGLAWAIRASSGPPVLQPVEAATAAGPARYRLLSIPAYLVEELPRLLDELRAEP